MKFSTFTVLVASFAAAANAQAGCSEAARFGVLQVVPSDLHPGDSFTVHADFSCGFSKGYNATYIDYYITVPAIFNNGHQPPILLARRELHNGPGGPVDTFTADINKDYPWVFGSKFEVSLFNTYPYPGGLPADSGSPVFLQGGTETPINITAASN